MSRARVGAVSAKESTPRHGLFVYWSETDQAFIAEVPELPGCAADGPTYRAALERLGLVDRHQWHAASVSGSYSVGSACTRAAVSRSTRITPSPLGRPTAGERQRAPWAESERSSEMRRTSIAIVPVGESTSRAVEAVRFPKVAA